MQYCKTYIPVAHQCQKARYCTNTVYTLISLPRHFNNPIHTTATMNVYWNSEYRGTAGSPSCACQLYLTVLRLCSFCDYRNCGSTPQANNNFPDFFLISLTFTWPISNFPTGWPHWLWVSHILSVFISCLCKYGCANNVHLGKNLLPTATVRITNSIINQINS